MTIHGAAVRCGLLKSAQFLGQPCGFYVNAPGGGSSPRAAAARARSRWTPRTWEGGAGGALGSQQLSKAVHRWVAAEQLFGDVVLAEYWPLGWGRRLRPAIGYDSGAPFNIAAAFGCLGWPMELIGANGQVLARLLHGSHHSSSPHVTYNS
jgi:hypothetical protein